jgi:hypothetical protein
VRHSDSKGWLPVKPGLSLALASHRSLMADGF